VKGLMDRALAHTDLPTMVGAALLLLAALLVIRIGKALLFASMFGAMAAGVSVGEGNHPRTAALHAATAFGVAAATLLLLRLTRNRLLWLLIIAAGVGALMLYGYAR
jgi:hypothetical protein